MCGGFVCSKNALTALNILYLIVSFVLIGVASYAKAAAVITSLQLAGGIIASGLFLFFISLLGLFAASKHHQVLLFFYVVVLFLLFLIQFTVSIACLALSKQQEEDLISTAWNSSSEIANKTRIDAEAKLTCCGWDTQSQLDPVVVAECTNIEGLKCTINSTATQPGVTAFAKCSPCRDILVDAASNAMVAIGGIGLFFSFTEMLGVYLAIRFRNQKDPRANPSQFL